MKNLLNTLITFYTWETKTTSDRVFEVITKAWITGLFVLFIVGWTTIVTASIINPSMWDGVQFGLIDTLGD